LFLFLQGHLISSQLFVFLCFLFLLFALFGFKK
jgi:hypothetical protein